MITMRDGASATPTSAPGWAVQSRSITAGSRVASAILPRM